MYHNKVIVHNNEKKVALLSGYIICITFFALYKEKKYFAIVTLRLMNTVFHVTAIIYLMFSMIEVFISYAKFDLMLVSKGKLDDSCLHIPKIEKKYYGFV